MSNYVKSMTVFFQSAVNKNGGEQVPILCAKRGCAWRETGQKSSLI
jgi:hypothetical protein